MSSLRSASRPWARLVGRPVLVVALVGLTVLALADMTGSLQAGVLTMLPALALAVMMLTRPYLGERFIARLRTGRPRHPSAAGQTVGFRRPVASVARGGLLIAVALAGRAPPAALAGCL